MNECSSCVTGPGRGGRPGGRSPASHESSRLGRTSSITLLICDEAVLRGDDEPGRDWVSAYARCLRKSGEVWRSFAADGVERFAFTQVTRRMSAPGADRSALTRSSDWARADRLPARRRTERR
jgi:hypothetical protein